MPASDLQNFWAYARGFEAAFWGDAWAALGAHFTDDAEHVVHDGGPLATDDRGRAGVVEGLRTSVYGLDRRFDVRIPEVIAGPVTRPEGIWMRFAVTLRRAGLPELRFEGDHLARMEGGRIRRIDEWMAPDAAGLVQRHLAEHGDRLRPVGAPASPPTDARDLRELDSALVRSLVRGYGCAKSEQDVRGALALCTEDFVLETISLGLATQDRKAAEAQLGLFFGAFPDYAVTLDRVIAADGEAACWGRARLTFRGPFAGHAPTGRRAELPIFCVFGAANGSLRSERFFFDLASLCEQVGLPFGALQDTLRGLRAASGEPARHA